MNVATPDRSPLRYVVALNVRMPVRQNLVGVRHLGIRECERGDHCEGSYWAEVPRHLGPYEPPTVALRFLKVGLDKLITRFENL